MPPKKEVKAEEPLFVDEEGSFVHEAEQAKYRGGVRRYTLANGAEGGAAAGAAAGGSGGGGKSPSPSPNSKGGAAAAGAANPAPSAAAGAAGSTTSAAAASSTASAGGAAANTAGASDGLPLYRHGRGVYICPTFTYDGEWEEDAMHGHGTLTFTVSGNTYCGAFSRGCFAGEGTYTWKDGAVYVGQWRANRMHGLGVYTDAQGHLWRGRYFNGTGPGLIRLYPTLEPAEGVAMGAAGSATPSAATGGAAASHSPTA